MEKVLVLMSTYNGEKYLEEQIVSILNQEGCIIELFVRDDGSSDRTSEIIRKYIELGKPVSLLKDEGNNLRTPRSFLRLLKNATNEYDYYAFADQDDVWDCDKIINGISQLKNCKKPMLYCANARLVNEKLESLERNVYQRKKNTNYKNVILTGNYMGCTMVFNRYLKCIFDDLPELAFCHMHDAIIAMLCVLHGGNVVFDETPHMSYRQTGNNTVGVSLSALEKAGDKLSAFYIKSRWRSRQCQALLEVMNDGEPEVVDFFKTVSEIPKKRRSRWKVVLDKEIKYETLMQRLEVMIRILRGQL